MGIAPSIASEASGPLREAVELRKSGAQLGGNGDRAERLPVDRDVDGLPGGVELHVSVTATDRVADGDRRVADGDGFDVDAERRRERERRLVVGLGVDERQTPRRRREDLLETDSALGEERGVGVVEPLEEAREEDDPRSIDFLEENGARVREDGHGRRRIDTRGPQSKIDRANGAKSDPARIEPPVAAPEARRENPRVALDPLREPEDRFVDAVGGAIEFWGFRRVLGHIWGWLYLQGTPRTAPDICARLGLSKALVSTSLTELERWGCVRRFRRPGSRREMFEAEQDVWAMVSRVFRERELVMVKQVAETLDAVGEDLKVLGKKSGPAREEAKARLERVQRMGDLAQFAAIAISGFLEQGLADVRPLKND